MTGEPQDERVALAWRDIAAAVQRVQRGIGAAMEDTGVSVQEFAVLNALLRADDHRASMKVLADEVSMTSGGFTKLADRMARDGLIDRRGSDDDRRVIRAGLTAEGERRARRAVASYTAVLREQLLATLTLTELDSMAAALRALAPVEHEAADHEFAPRPRPAGHPERRTRR